MRVIPATLCLEEIVVKLKRREKNNYMSLFKKPCPTLPSLSAQELIRVTESYIQVEFLLWGPTLLYYGKLNRKKLTFIKVDRSTYFTFSNLHKKTRRKKFNENKVIKKLKKICKKKKTTGR